jgi:lipopolysaccharide heptosyltransferase II
MISWKDCKKILCIRADNMGDIIMMTPALRALKESFGAEITLLTSSQGAPVCECIAEVDHVIVADLPWVKLNKYFDPQQYVDLVSTITERHFDGAIIFTVYSQSALPAAMLCFQAAIPRRLAYVRENPYLLLTHWVPDREPYSMIRHQVERDLALVREIDAVTSDDKLNLQISADVVAAVENKLNEAGLRAPLPYLVLHTGVSEAKREYPAENWSALIKAMAAHPSHNIILTGSLSEKQRVASLMSAGYTNVFNLSGMFTIRELGALIARASVVVSVNTAIVHIAAAVETPVVVLYALTNPQHTPWKVPNVVLPFSVDDNMKSRNEIIKYVDRTLFNTKTPVPTVDEVLQAVSSLYNAKGETIFNTMPGPPVGDLQDS